MQNRIARIENAFVESARYSLNVREQKVILYLIAKIDPREENFCKHCIPVKELEEVLKKDGKKWGGLYEEMEQFTDRITDRKISFPSDFTVNGKPFKGHINWFAHAIPTANEKGEVCIEFEFAPILKNFLLNLREFVQIDRAEISDMKSRYSIRIYQLLKAALQKQEKYKKTVIKKCELNELRELFDLGDKYQEFKSFSQFVLMPAVKEVNELTSIHVEPRLIRNRLRKVETVDFYISYKKDVPLQLSLLDAGEKKKIADMSRGEIEGKRKQFNFQKFKKEYPKVYRERVQEVQEVFKGKQVVNEMAIENSVRGLCETWFIEHIAV